uniref:Uncharacterized protein n=1 Tax=Glossina austeni TaxID=7395 RepID=A0A1A9UPH1_GLOAU
MAFGVCGECMGIIIGFFSPLGPDAVVGTLELGFVVAAGGRMVLLSGLGAAEFAFRAGVLAEGCEAGVLLPVSDLHIPGYNRSTLGVELSLAFVVFCWATVPEFSKEVCEEAKELRCPFVLSSLTAVSLPKLRSCAPFSICCCNAIKLEKLGKFGGCACCCNLTISRSKANRILSSAAKPLNVLPGIPAAADLTIPNFSSSTKLHLIYELYAHQTYYRHGHRTAGKSSKNPGFCQSKAARTKLLLLNLKQRKRNSNIQSCYQNISPTPRKFRDPFDSSDTMDRELMGINFYKYFWSHRRPDPPRTTISGKLKANIITAYDELIKVMPWLYMTQAKHEAAEVRMCSNKK